MYTIFYSPSSLLMDIWINSSLGITYIVLQWVALYIRLFVFLPAYLWDRFLEVGLLDQKVNTYVILLAVANKNTTPFTRVVSLYFTCLITCLTMKCVVKLLEFFPISQCSFHLHSFKMSNFAPLSICLRTICNSKNSLFMYFAHFFIRSLISLVFSQFLGSFFDVWEILVL